MSQIEEKKSRWIMIRDGIGNIWIGQTKGQITDPSHLLFEVYQVVKFAGTHKGLLGLALMGPNEDSRIHGGETEMFVARIEWAVWMAERAISLVRSKPWSR